MNIYLSGGMHTDWRQKVMMAVDNAMVEYPELPEITFFDPMFHLGTKSEDAYTLWNTQAISRCQVVFAFVEDTNPSGANTCFEIGYAKGQAKSIKVILVDQKKDKYHGMARAAADVVVETVEEGIAVLCDLVTTFPGWYT